MTMSTPRVEILSGALVALAMAFLVAADTALSGVAFGILLVAVLWTGVCAYRLIRAYTRGPGTASGDTP